MSDSKCMNEEFVTFQLTQCLSGLLETAWEGAVDGMDPCYGFFMDQRFSETDDYPSVFGDVDSDDSMTRWIHGLQSGEPLSLSLLCKALDRSAINFEVVKNNIYQTHSRERWEYRNKIKTLEEQLKKEKGPKTKALEKVGKKKKGKKS